jgi:hypothetical protein
MVVVVVGEGGERVSGYLLIQLVGEQRPYDGVKRHTMSWMH